MKKNVTKKISVKELREKLVMLRAFGEMPITKTNLQLQVEVRKLKKHIESAMEPANEAYEQRVSEIRIQYAMTGENGAVIIDKDTGGFQYTPISLISLEKFIRAANKELSNTMLDIQTNIVPAALIPTECDPFMKESLSGLLF